jgi:hypothetical protein
MSSRSSRAAWVPCSKLREPMILRNGIITSLALIPTRMVGGSVS